MKKRTWHYIHQPDFYNVYCMRKGKINKDHKTAWSEYEGMIWCFDCKMDMTGFGGIFEGPIAFEAAKVMLGERCFDRYNMRTKKILHPTILNGKLVWKTDKAATKLLVKRK